MARAALDLSLDRLAETSGIGRRTIARFEAGESVSPETVEALRSAFAREGVEFQHGELRSGVSYLRRD
jgi:transcriptional regulator with XRE-family HTH domain